MNALETSWARFRLDPRVKMIAPSLERSGLYVFLISFVCVYYVSNAAIMLDHLDLGWHLAAGDLIRERGEVPFQDPWSFTLGDRQWYNLSWLWDVIASAIFQYSGFSGLIILTVACGAMIIGLLASVCLSSGASASAVCIAVFAACLIYPSFATKPCTYLAVSPNTATMLFCVVFYKICLDRKHVLALPPIMVLWVNLHGGFPLGFLVLGIFWITAMARRDWGNLRNYSVAGSGCLSAIFINPLGWHIYDGVAATLGNFVQAYITEWQSYFETLAWPRSIPGVVYIVTFIALEFRDRNCHATPLESRLLSWLFLFLGLDQFRYLAFFFIFSTVPMARHIDRLLPARMKAQDVQGSLLAAGIIGLLALPLTLVHVQPSLALSDILSRQDIAYLQGHLAHKHVLNHWNVGGNLIFGARESVPVFVDGRAATAYPDDLLRDYFKLARWEVDEAVWDEILEKYKIDAVLWIRDHDELTHFLVDKKGWKQEYTGLHTTVYVKP